MNAEADKTDAAARPGRPEGLEQIKTPLIDRAAPENLLRVYAASRSVSCTASVATKPGRTFLTDHGLLAQRLGNIAAGEVVILRSQAPRGLGNQREEISHDLADHSIVTCIEPQNLLRQLMELAQASGGTLV